MDDLDEFLELLSKKNHLSTDTDHHYLTLDIFCELFPEIQYPKIGEDFEDGIIVDMTTKIMVNVWGEIEICYEIESSTDGSIDCWWSEHTDNEKSLKILFGDDYTLA